MAQHDYVIANDTAANVRGDINDALAAIVSQNSGASEPSTTYANQLWYDSTNDVLKMRNETDTAWIDVVTLDQTNDVAIAALQVGMVLPFAFTSPPTGWLECDGSTISRTTYATLFSEIGTTFGSGDGSTTFGLPDLRGEFIRGWDNGRGVNSGRSFGSAESWAIENITGFQDTYPNTGAINPAEGGAFSASTAGGLGLGANFAAGSAIRINFNASNVVQTSTETRPRNVALMYCIKF